ncbi:hypothetical protein F4804DRAFT_227779 [Jackrogersella minutella]|nr:hypothetical protein F4804DRAFT_227779 [Jackrogersella minutella]
MKLPETSPLADSMNEIDQLIASEMNYPAEEQPEGENSGVGIQVNTQGDFNVADQVMTNQPSIDLEDPAEDEIVVSYDPGWLEDFESDDPPALTRLSTASEDDRDLPEPGDVHNGQTEKNHLSTDHAERAEVGSLESHPDSPREPSTSAHPTEGSVAIQHDQSEPPRRRRTRQEIYGDEPSRRSSRPPKRRRTVLATLYQKMKDELFDPDEESLLTVYRVFLAAITGAHVPHRDNLVKVPRNYKELKTHPNGEGFKEACRLELRELLNRGPSLDIRDVQPDSVDPCHLPPLMPQLDVLGGIPQRLPILHPSLLNLLFRRLTHKASELADHLAKTPCSWGHLHPGTIY